MAKPEFGSVPERALNLRSQFDLMAVIFITFTRFETSHDLSLPCNAILFPAGRQRLPDRAQHISAGWKGKQVCVCLSECAKFKAVWPIV